MSATVAHFPARMTEMDVQTLPEGKRDFPKLIESGADVVDTSNVDKVP